MMTKGKTMTMFGDWCDSHSLVPTMDNADRFVTERTKELEREIMDGFNAIFPYVPQAEENGKHLTLADKIKLLIAEFDRINN